MILASAKSPAFGFAIRAITRSSASISATGARLREQDLHKIVDTFTRQDESDPRYARMVPVADIADPKNDYNLNLPRYIDSTEPEDLQDIDGHQRGRRGAERAKSLDECATLAFLGLLGYAGRASGLPLFHVGSVSTLFIASMITPTTRLIRSTM